MDTIFLDTEFSALSQNAKLLSIALVPQKGEWFYAVFTNEDTESLSAWHQENVVPSLYLNEKLLAAIPPGKHLYGNRSQVVTALKKYLAGFDKIIVWADVPAYDWVLFCELFGGAFGLPDNIHYMVRDLATLFELKGYDIDTDRFDFAYNEQGAAAGARVSSADGRAGEGQASAKTTDGLLRHNALGDAMAGMRCWKKIMGE